MFYSLHSARRCGRGLHAGFTLIELLVVVLIIGILAAVAVPRYQFAVERSRAAEAFVFVRSIADAEQRYYMANGEYAEDVNLLDITFSGTSVPYHGTIAFQTDHFLCRPFCSSSSCLADTLAACNRLPVYGSYNLLRKKNGQMACFFYNDEGERVCKTFGGKKVSTHYVF